MNGRVLSLEQNRFQTVPTKMDWMQTQRYWDVAEASILWQGHKCIQWGPMVIL